MRTFEVALLLVNVVSLFLSFKKPPRMVGLGVAGVNLLVLLIHGVVEGFRYQMAFSYLFVILLGAYALANMNHRIFEARLSRALKGVVLFLALVGLGFSALLATALPIFILAAPTGPYPVGMTYLHFVDESRTDPFLDPSTQNRELMVKVYYPAQPDDSKPFSPYFHNSAELLRLLSAWYGMPDFVFSHLSLVKTNSKEDLQVSEAQDTYPVILFSHGAGMTMEAQTYESEDLASHGYIVVNIDHPYVSTATVFPDRIVSARDATTDFKVVEPADIITQIMADDARFVIDQLSDINDGTLPSLFKARLNLNQIGAMGHSVGGAVAYNLAINDPRVKAAINLDGTVYITPQETMAPFLMLANDKYHVQAIQARIPLMPKLDEMSAEDRDFFGSIYGGEAVYNEAYDKAQQNIMGLADELQASGNLFTIEGSDHMKFIDVGLFIGISPLREIINIGGETDPARCLNITRAVTLTFFDQHLKGEAPESFDTLLQKYPELKRVDLQ